MADRKSPMVRIDRPTYAATAEAAKALGVSIAAFVSKALSEALKPKVAKCPLGHDDCAVFASMAGHPCSRKETP